MALTRTSRSRLFDRVVRVERRHRNRDFMGGSYADFETIIPRYHVRLWPDTHRRRQREETGEVLADPQAFRALGNPSHNGRTIMYGDRFVDDKNHQCYTVVSVWRPKGRAGWSLTNQYELRIIEDCPQAAAAVPTGSDLLSAAPPPQRHYIMRHFGQAELAGWEALPYFDGFVYNLQTDAPADLLTLANAVAAGKQWFRYYNIQSYPFSATEAGGLTPPLATWFNWLRSNIQFLATASHRRMRVATQVALFPGAAFTSPLGQQHELIPWGVVSTAERQAAVQQMADLANNPGGLPLPVQGVFLDQSWLKVESFQVETDLFAESGHGDTEESGPPLTALSFGDAVTAFGDGGPWTTHTTAMMALYTEIAAVLAPAGQYAIKNGDHRTQNGQVVPKPWYFENAWNSNVDGATQPERWAFAKAQFATDPRNVLSILCSAADNATVGVPEALDHWEATGGWLAFTQNANTAEAIANQEAAYAQAAQRLAQLGWPR